jgi:hypothetical protein
MATYAIGTITSVFSHKRGGASYAIRLESGQRFDADLNYNVQRLSLFPGDIVLVNKFRRIFYRFPVGVEPSERDRASAVGVLPELPEDDRPPSDGVYRASPTSETRAELIARGLLRPRGER